MRYITNVALAIHGTRYEKGEEIELTKAQSAHLDPADITPVSAMPHDAEEEPGEPVALNDMSADQLKAKAKELGLAASGSKAALLERIQLHLEGKDETVPAEEHTEEQA